MSAEWNGALTFKGIAFSLRAPASSRARTTAVACPAMTICPGAL